jgi:hypothetical protein
MYKFLVLALIAVAAAAPNHADDPAWQTAQVGEWVETPREGHAVAETIKETASGILGSLSNWWTWDRNTVKDGIFKNENIMIHVGQNLFNFVMTTLAWFTMSQIYSINGDNTVAGADGRSSWGRALTLNEAADEVLDAIRQFEEKRR